jgi:hypothetical protein
MPDPNFEICQAKNYNDFSPKLLHLFGVFGNKCLCYGIDCNHKEAKDRKMTVDLEYVANLVAQLNADKIERDNIALADAMTPERYPDCDQCGAIVDDSFGCYFCD